LQFQNSKEIVMIHDHLRKNSMEIHKRETSNLEKETHLPEWVPAGYPASVNVRTRHIGEDLGHFKGSTVRHHLTWSQRMANMKGDWRRKTKGAAEEERWECFRIPQFKSYIWFGRWGCGTISMASNKKCLDHCRM